jgi:hypothetical protein
MKYASDRPFADPEKAARCPACKGTGFPVVMQPVQPDRKIYPVRCKACAPLPD